LHWQQDVTVTQAKQLTTVAATVGNGWSNSWQRLEQQLATVGATVGNGCSNSWQRLEQQLATAAATF